MSENIDRERLDRFEQKLDKMGDAITLLARIDERMLSHIEQAKRMAQRQEKIERRIDNLEMSRAKFVSAVTAISSAVAVIGPYISKIIFG